MRANIINRTLIALRKKRAFRLINGKYAGKSNFEKKRKLLCKAGFDIGKGTKIVGPIYISAKLKIGENVWIGRNCSFEGNGTIIISNNCDIAPNVIICTGSHKIGSISKGRMAGDGFNIDIFIGEGCWICNSARIFTKKIGNYSVVAAGSVVVNELPERILAAGVPARVKKYYLSNNNLTK